MPEPTGPRRTRPRRLARRLLDEELKATARRNTPRANPAPIPAPQRGGRGSSSTSRAADDVADELFGFFRELLRRLRNRRRRQPTEEPGAGQDFQQPWPVQGPDPWAAPPPQTRPLASAAPPWAAEGPGFQQHAAAPGYPPQGPGFAPPAPGFVPQGPGFAPPAPGFVPPRPEWAFVPPAQQPDGRRRLMKQPSEGPMSARDEYESLRNHPQHPQPQAAVQDAMRKLIEDKTRYREAARRNRVPFAVSLKEAAEAKARNTATPKPERSWLSRLIPWRSAKSGNTEGRSVKAEPAASARTAAVSGARLAAPPRLPHLPDYASGQVPGPRAESAVSQAVSRVAAPARGNSASHTAPPPVPPKVPPVPPKLPIVPPKIPLDTPGAEPGSSPGAPPAGLQPSPPAGPVSSPASPAMPPVSPVSRPVSPVSPPVSPVSPATSPVFPPSPVSRPASPAFSSTVANRSLEHHRSSREARGQDSSTTRSQPSYRAPAVQQTGTAKRAPSRGR